MIRSIVKIAVIAVCCWVVWVAFGLWEYSDQILHNGTNVDDDDARIVGGIAQALGFVAFMVGGILVVNLGVNLINSIRRNF